MGPALTAPANATILGVPAVIFSILIPLLTAGFLGCLFFRRLAPLRKAAPDPRFDRIKTRVINTFMVPHHRMPRYLPISVLHLCFLSCFIIISLRWISLVFLGIADGFVLPGLGGVVGLFYGMLKDIFSTVLLAVCCVAIIRQVGFKPERYLVPEKYGNYHTRETVFGLTFILMIVASDMFFEGSLAAAQIQTAADLKIIIPGTGIWLAAHILDGMPLAALQGIHLFSYYLFDLTFFAFLCFLPFGRFFHLLTALPNLFSMKLDKGTVKPVKWGADQTQIEALESFGVKKFKDFTWKHVLDFFSCADCGRCSDHCPAHAVGRPLSPRLISTKCRNHAYAANPLFAKKAPDDRPLVGHILDEDEIWSCTTCGACEEECPLMIEYIDKIVDLRRGMVEEGMVPQSLQKPLSALEKRGNPYGKMEKKRADWIQALPENIQVKILDPGKETADTLYFVDSITSYDDRIQEIGRATARVLSAAGIDFGILGAAERDSGHEVRRFGEEMLFFDLKDKNTAAILSLDLKNIVTSDPHTFNALKNDYTGLPPVAHISQVIENHILSGKIRLKGVENPEEIYTYHDPCYLGRHNGIYDAPRNVIDAIAGTRRVEMTRCKDRSFCCGGGGLMLFYEPVEKTRMGTLRVEAALESGASVIVTACPFCMVNIEDAIKTSGLEGKMQVMDLVELVDRHLVIEN